MAAQPLSGKLPTKVSPYPKECSQHIEKSYSIIICSRARKWKTLFTHTD